MTRTGIAITFGGGLAALTMTTAAVAAPAPAWHNVPTAAPIRPAALNTIAVADSRTAWTAGMEDSGTQSPIPVTALFRWNGQKWSRQVTPVQLVPVGLAAADAKHAWAIGLGYWGPTSIYWNGTSWRQVDYAAGIPIALSAARDGSAWSIAGAIKDGAPTVLRWSLSQGWSRVAIPLPPNTGLASVGARTASDVWLTGQYGSDKDHMHPLVMHWNGVTWSRTPVPEPLGASAAEWVRITPVSPTSVWAIRSPGASALMHWDGHRWSEASRVPGGRGALSVAGDGGSGAWVIPFTTGSATRTYYLHWTGHGWQPYYGPKRNGNAQLGDLALIPGGHSLLATGAIQEMTPRRKMPLVELFR